MLSIIIPTLQRSVETLDLLLKTLDEDSSVGEIIVIDNSLKGLNFSTPKIRTIIPDENLYVNPSWNLGVREARYNKIGLLNDDIAIPKSFCTKISKYIKEDIGIIGMKFTSVVPVEKITKSEENETEIELLPVNYRDGWFGIAMFFHKNSYSYIPEEMKIHAGDDWIVYQCKKKRKQNFVIANTRVYHLGSLSSSDKKFNPIEVSDSKIYRKLTMPWYKKILYYDEHRNHYKFKILGLTLNIRKSFINKIYKNK